jgi:hypothetical protein
MRKTTSNDEKVNYYQLSFLVLYDYCFETMQMVNFCLNPDLTEGFLFFNPHSQSL